LHRTQSCPVAIEIRVYLAVLVSMLLVSMRCVIMLGRIMLMVVRLVLVSILMVMYSFAPYDSLYGMASRFLSSMQQIS